MSEEQQKVFGIVEQYVKDLSVENLLTAQDMIEKTLTPNGDVSLNMSSEELGNNLYQINLQMTVSAKDAEKDKALYIVEVDYIGIAHIEGFEEEAAAIIGVEVPRALFPFVRQVIANATADAGFPPLMLNPIDFLSLFIEQQMQDANPQEVN